MAARDEPAADTADTAAGVTIAARAAGDPRVLVVGALGILVAASLWALVGVVTRALYSSAAISPLAVGALRLVLAAPALLATSATIERPRWRIARRDWWLFAGYGVATAGYQLGFLAALTSTSVTAATLLLTSAPVFVALLAAIFLGERPSPLRAVLLALALTGAALVVLGSGAGASVGAGQLMPGDAAALRGDALALCAAVAYACYYLFSSILGRRYGGVQVMGIAIGAGACLLVPLALVFGGLARSMRVLPVTGWALILVLALGSTALAYAIYGLALRWVPATLASIVALVEPLVASLLAWRLLGEHLAPLGLLGGALLLGGIAATTVARAREGRPHVAAPDVAA